MRRSAACSSVSTSEFPSRIHLTYLDYAASQGAPGQCIKPLDRLASFRLLEPALWILVVIQRDSLVCQLECVLSIEHHCELFSARRVLTGHDRARMRSVRNPARVQRNRCWFNAAPGSEIPTHVKQDFVGFDIVVHPRNSHGFGMRVEHARRERAHYVAANFKGLMNRRRLMYRACNRLEILGVERKRVNVSIPTNDVEWMMRHRHHSPARAVFDQNFGVAFLIDHVQLSWPVQIALGIRRT